MTHSRSIVHVSCTQAVVRKLPMSCTLSYNKSHVTLLVSYFIAMNCHSLSDGYKRTWEKAYYAYMGELWELHELRHSLWSTSCGENSKYFKNSFKAFPNNTWKMQTYMSPTCYNIPRHLFNIYRDTFSTFKRHGEFSKKWAKTNVLAQTHHSVTGAFHKVE